MKILAIETSCDETAVAVLEADGGVEDAHFRVLGNALYSQAALHSVYGGVYPNLAKREHQENLVPLTTEALKEAGLLEEAGENTTIHRSDFGAFREEAFRDSVIDFVNHYEKPEIDLIAVTKGPGLEPALWTGITFAEALGTAWRIPVLGENHMEGHIVSALLKKSGNDNSKFKIQNSKFPLLALLISGGHTELVLMKKWFEYELVGKTRDDAVGEAFDKVARLLGLPYPGGPEIDRAAARARARATRTSDVLVSGINLPRPMLHDDSGDFSFSGLKTAVLYLVRDKNKNENALSEEEKEDIAREFEDAAADVLVAKTERALSKTNAKTLVVGGGVSANTHIRGALETLIRTSFPHTALYYPERGLTGDNAVMIGAAAYLRHKTGTSKEKMSRERLVARGSLSLAPPHLREL